MAENQDWTSVSDDWAANRDHIDRMSRPITDWLVTALDPQPGQTILELAGGLGDIGVQVAEKVGPEGKVILTDISEGMVEQSRRTVAAAGATNVTVRQMDAQESDLDTDSVDGVLCRFGFMLMPEPARALAEARRVVREGGRLSLAVWGAGPDNLWMLTLGMAAMQVGIEIGMDPFGPGGVFSMGEPARIEELLRGAGFKEMKVEPIDITPEFESFDAYWDVQSRLAGPVADALRSSSEEKQAAAKEAARVLAEPHTQDGGSVRFTGRALGAWAR